MNSQPPLSTSDLAERLFRWAYDRGWNPPVSKFQSGATLEQVEQLEPSIGYPLPVDYREFLRYTNGQYLEMGGDSSRLFPWFQVFPTDYIVADCPGWRAEIELIERRDMTPEMLADDAWYRVSPQIRRGLIHSSWIPIGDANMLFEPYCVDMDPSSLGTVGQLIQKMNGSTVYKAPSFGSYLQEVVEHLETFNPPLIEINASQYVNYGPRTPTNATW
jgi:cell wall assembly regulator SMI1